MKTLLLLISLSFVSSLFAQDMSLTENSDAQVCGRTVRVDGIWIDNGRIKADISVLIQKNSKPIIGSYKMGDTIDIKTGCRYFIKLIEKFGLNSNTGWVVFSQQQDISDYLGLRLSTLRMNDKFNIGGNEWLVTGISKDEAQFRVENGLNYDTVTLKKNDMIWKRFGAYYIADIIDESTDVFYKSWKIELKDVKDYSYLNTTAPVIRGEDMNAPKGIDSPTMLILRKMKYYPKQKFVQEEYDATPVKYWVLKVFMYHTGIARPMIEIDFLGNKSMEEYEGFKSFDTEEEALEFAKVNNVMDIILEEK
ncbi:MAG: hypothetical protein J0M18_16990 [Ignavibacteria bacterium]|nr:hypothetical protein [Ignavibacteria bacterium]